MSAYKKENALGKIYVRSLAYNKICERLGFKRMANSAHLVTTSADCGDIRLQLGTFLADRPQNVIATDIVKKYLTQAATLFPGITTTPVKGGRIEDTVKWATEQGLDIGTVNVDLCNTCAIGLPVLTGCIAANPTVPFYLFTFLRNRSKLSFDQSMAEIGKIAQAFGYSVLLHENYQSRTSENAMGSAMTMVILEKNPVVTSYSERARKAHATMRAKGIKPGRKANAAKLSEAGKKAWETRRANLEKAKELA